MIRAWTTWPWSPPMMEGRFASGRWEVGSRLSSPRCQVVVAPCSTSPWTRHLGRFCRLPGICSIRAFRSLRWHFLRFQTAWQCRGLHGMTSSRSGCPGRAVRSSGCGECHVGCRLGYREVGGGRARRSISHSAWDEPVAGAVCAATVAVNEGVHTAGGEKAGGDGSRRRSRSAATHWGTHRSGQPACAGAARSASSSQNRPTLRSKARLASSTRRAASPSASGMASRPSR